MSRYRMEDDTMVDTKVALASWKEDKRFDGRNMVSVATGSQFEHQELYRSKKGRFYLECWSQWQGSVEHAEYISEREAAVWLLQNGHKLPEYLAHYEVEVVE